jgi:hypothetical protein
VRIHIINRKFREFLEAARESLLEVLRGMTAVEKCGPLGTQS